MRQLPTYLLLLLAFCAAQMPACAEPNDDGAMLMITQPSVATTFNPATSIPNALVFWNYRDWPQGPVTTSVADEISGVQLKPWLGTVTNTGFGLYFNGSSGLSNATIDIPPNSSVWIVYCDLHANNLFAQLYGTQANNSTNIQVNHNNGGPAYLNGRWNSTTDNEWVNPLGIFGSGETVTNGPLWQDMADSQGSVSINGQATAGNISGPTGHWPGQAMGDCLTGSGNPGGLVGYIKYMLVITNRAFTALEVSNLYAWDMTNGMSNITSGQIAYYKLTEGSGTTLADASGNGFTGFLHGSPAPTWLAGLNSVVNHSILFDGSQNCVCVPITSAIFPGTAYSISAWIRWTTPGFGEGCSFFGFYGSGPNGGLGASDSPFSTIGSYRGGVSPASGANIFVETDNPAAIGTNAASDWHHVVFCGDGTLAGAIIYLDGVICQGTAYGGTGPISGGTLPITTWMNGVTNFEWGAMPAPVLLNGAYTATNISFATTLVQPFNRILTPAEVDNLYRAPAADLIKGSQVY